jgi:hypothetical protein
MTALVVVTIVVILVVIVALAVTNPLMRRREDEAIAMVKRELGGTFELIEPRTTAMGTEPEEAGGLRGMACLGLGSAELVAVTWARSTMWRIPRAAVTGVDTSSDDPTVLPKATITVTYARPEGGEATAMFRLRDAADWLTALGYDWGDDGPPGADELDPDGLGSGGSDDDIDDEPDAKRSDGS